MTSFRDSTDKREIVRRIGFKFDLVPGDEDITERRLALQNALFDEGIYLQGLTLPSSSPESLEIFETGKIEKDTNYVLHFNINGDAHIIECGYLPEAIKQGLNAINTDGFVFGAETVTVEKTNNEPFVMKYTETHFTVGLPLLFGNHHDDWDDDATEEVGCDKEQDNIFKFANGVKFRRFSYTRSHLGEDEIHFEVWAPSEAEANSDETTAYLSAFWSAIKSVSLDIGTTPPSPTCRATLKAVKQVECDVSYMM